MKLDEIVELKELMLIMRLSTPDGRWETLQDFLDEHPRWKKREKDFLEADPIKAPQILCQWLKIPPAMLPFIDKDGELRKEAINTFTELQLLYKGRKSNA